MKFAGGNHYHKQIKWLHFGRNWNRNEAAEYERKFESLLIDFAMMSNRCWRLAN